MNYSDYITHLKKEIICYRCKWGAEPGELSRCGNTALKECERYALPSIATVKGKCPKYEKGKPIAHPKDDELTEQRAWRVAEVPQ